MLSCAVNVEMEIVLPADMTVRDSHDLALGLQHKIESLEEVERAFVHVDHDKRDGLEHKVERKLIRGLLCSMFAMCCRT
jgi:divalent metal cation (Fe/Co/Zn/Cd) transporter